MPVLKYVAQAKHTRFCPSLTRYSSPNSAIVQIPELEQTPMQRRFSALIAWIILAALVRSIAATDLVHCGQSTLPETDEIVCLGQYV